MEKVGHQAKLRQALRVVTKKRNSEEPTTEDNVATTNNTGSLTPSTMTVNFLPSPTTTTHPSTL